MKKALLFFCFLAISSSTFGQNIKVKVYFPNEKLNPNFENCRLVHPVQRTIPKTKAVAKAALLELFKGVTKEEKEKGFWSVPAEETKGILKRVKIKNKFAYVNFNKVVYDQLGSATTSCGAGILRGIEETLQQFPTIDKVFFAIEGSPADFYDWVQVGECPDELKNCDSSNF